MQNITEGKVLEIDETALLSEIAVGGKEPNISFKKVGIVQQVNIIQWPEIWKGTLFSGRQKKSNF